MHAIPARQRVPTLSHCFANAYSRIGDANSNIRSTLVRDGT